MSIAKLARPAWVVASLIAAYAMTGACSHERPPQALSTVALVNDPVALDRALARCNRSSTGSTGDAECRNVRAAIARLAEERRGRSRNDKREAQEAQIKFEQEREFLRQRDEQQREQRERDKTAIDPYSMPFVPPESPHPKPASG